MDVYLNFSEIINRIECNIDNLEHQQLLMGLKTELEGMAKNGQSIVSSISLALSRIRVERGEKKTYR